MKSLILGGVKSGKSRYAENMLSEFLQANQLDDKQACLIATAQALDEGMSVRIAKHKQQRPASWHLLEEPINLAQAIQDAETFSKIILIDCLTLWLTNLLMKEDALFLNTQIDLFLSAVSKSQSELVLVSNETNMGVMPLGQLTRDYCDQAGILHQRLAELCDRVCLVVAGLPLVLKKTIETV